MTDTAAGRQEPAWLFRTHHDPDRPAVDTGEAARRLALSRQAVTDQIRAGRLAGYGIQGPRRIRWWIYQDALRPSAGPDTVLANAERERDALREANAHLRDLHDLRDQIDEAGADLDEHLRAASEARQRLAALTRELGRRTADITQAAAGPQSAADLSRVEAAGAS